MKNDFLKKIKGLELLSKSESKTITGGYGGYNSFYCGQNLNYCSGPAYRLGNPVASLTCYGNYVRIYRQSGNYCWR